MEKLLLNEKTRELIEDSFVTVGFASASINQVDDEYELEFLDGFDHTWFYRTYPIDTDLNKILRDLWEFDTYEELEFAIKTDCADRPHISSIIACFEQIDESIVKTHDELWKKLHELGTLL